MTIWGGQLPHIFAILTFIRKVKLRQKKKTVLNLVFYILQWFSSYYILIHSNSKKKKKKKKHSRSNVVILLTFLTTAFTGEVQEKLWCSSFHWGKWRNYSSAHPNIYNKARKWMLRPTDSVNLCLYHSGVLILPSCIFSPCQDSHSKCFAWENPKQRWKNIYLNPLLHNVVLKQHSTFLTFFIRTALVLQNCWRICNNYNRRFDYAVSKQKSRHAMEFPFAINLKK